MMTKLAQSFVILSAVASIGLASTTALAEKVKEFRQRRCHLCQERCPTYSRSGRAHVDPERRPGR